MRVRALAGKGQTIHVIVTPEVKRLVKQIPVGSDSPRAVGASAGALRPSDCFEQKSVSMEVDIAAWLLLNQIRSEIMQASDS